MTAVVAVEASHDIPTRAAYGYRQRNLYPRVAAPHVLRLLRGPLAKRAYLTSAIGEVNPALLLGTGHGDPDTMMGYAWETLLERGIHDPVEVRGKIVHLLACETAQKLGPQVIAQGARAFLGYDWQVLLQEAVFEAFMECDTSIDLALLAGASVREAHRGAVALFDQHIGGMEPFEAAVMTTMRDSLRYMGDGNARL